MAKRPFIERMQALSGTTKQELLVAMTILGITLGALVYKWLNKPQDTFNQELNRQLSQMLDSAAQAEKQARMVDSIPLQYSAPIVGEKENDTSAAYAPLIYRGESQYKKKELPQQPININTAGKDELMKLPSVGEKMAQKIMAYRKRSPFRKPEDLMAVGGIGEKKFAKMKPYVMVK